MQAVPELRRDRVALCAALTCPLCQDVLRAAYMAPDCMHTCASHACRLLLR